MPFPSRILSYIRKYDLMRRGDKVIVGVSGGADSVALLRVLVQLQHELGLRLHVAHLNHQLRRGADTDQRFVVRLCAALNVPLTVKKWENPPRKTDAGSLEEKARQARLSFFRDVSRKERADKVALAHHKDDEAETVLMRVIRGSGLQGLRGIVPLTRLEGSVVVRPLLDVSRREIEAYLMKIKADYRTDPTNLTLEFTRNKIRHEVLPFLARYNSDIVSAVVNLGRVAEADYDLLEAKALKVFTDCVTRKGPRAVSLDGKKLRNQHVSLRRMLVRLAVAALKGDTVGINLGHIIEIDEMLLSDTDRSVHSVHSVHLPAGLTVIKGKDALIFTK